MSESPFTPGDFGVDAIQAPQTPPERAADELTAIEVANLPNARRQVYTQQKQTDWLKDEIVLLRTRVEHLEAENRKLHNDSKAHERLKERYRSLGFSTVITSALIAIGASMISSDGTHGAVFCVGWTLLAIGVFFQALKGLFGV